MAKTRTLTDFPIEEAWYTAITHFGPYDRADPAVWHAIWAYQAFYEPPGIVAYHIHHTEAAAFLEALDWSKLPQIVVDICPLCRAYAPGPHLPRWNIYRGPDWGKAPPCWLWDWWWGDWPPPPPLPPPW